MWGYNTGIRITDPYNEIQNKFNGISSRRIIE
jgi:hypothetical protein